MLFFCIKNQLMDSLLQLSLSQVEKLRDESLKAVNEMIRYLLAYGLSSEINFILT